MFVNAPRLGRTQLSAGLSDVEAGKEMHSDDMFRVGALTKAFTSTLILQLVEEGSISLDDTLDKWLPDALLDTIANGRTATIRQLLTVTSGIPNYRETAAYETAVATA